MLILKTIDAHAGGEPLRLVVEGFPSPRGKSLAEKRAWAGRNVDRLRRVLMLEPRGHRDMCGAVLTEPVVPGSHAGVLFMDGHGFSSMSDRGIMALATIALERGLIVPGGDGRSLTLDTPAGTVRARTSLGPTGKVVSVAVVNVPSFVMRGGVEIGLAMRRARVDIAFGGAFYAIVDGESVGVPLDAVHEPELRRVGTEIIDALDRSIDVTHPLDPTLTGIQGTVFTAPPRNPSADLRLVTVFVSGAIDRSACGTGTAAVMSVLDAMGLVDGERPFASESVLGTVFAGRVAGRTMVGEYPAIVPEIQGSAWITGEHTFLVDDEDPLGAGFAANP